jgi:acetyl esterase/lipase
VERGKSLRRVCLLIFISLVGKQYALSQQRMLLYPNDKIAVIAGFDSLPPFIDYYPAKGGTIGRTAILICPGGGYSHLAWDKEGVVPAGIFNAAGIDAFVLRYRLNNSKQQGHRFPDQYNDVTTALRMIKTKASTLGYNPEKVGIIGFSAGGHLASMATTMFTPTTATATDSLSRYNSRPAFSILVYPVIYMDTIVAHRGSRTMLLGSSPSPAMVDSLSTQNRVSAQTPPVMLVLADDDKAVIPQNSIGFYTALKKYKIPASMHIYDHGGHGFGTAPNDPVLNQWPKLCLEWMARLGFK